MNLLHRSFAFLLARVTVKPSTLNRSVGLLRIYLDERELEDAKDIPEDVCLKIVQEAWRRAAESEKDKVARCGRFYRQLDALAGEMVNALHGIPTADSRIRNILEFSKLL
jgi:hypothetical protein